MRELNHTGVVLLDRVLPARPPSTLFSPTAFALETAAPR